MIVPLVGTAQAGAALAGGVEIGRDDARRDAIRELGDARYAADDPNLVQRALEWLADRVNDLLERAAGVTPGGWVGTVLIAALIVVVVIAAWFGARAALRERGARSETDPLFGDQAPLTAQEHRVRAEEAQAGGDHAMAVREWFRAVVRGLEERGLLDLRPGRTADEAAVEIGGLFSDQVTPALTVAHRFDAVTFGSQQADADDARRAATLDNAVRSSVPTRAVPA